MLQHFNYLREIPLWLYQQYNKEYPWKRKYNPCSEYNLIGTRFSGKTWSVDDMINESIVVSLKINKPIFIFASMKMNKDVRGSIFETILNGLQRYNINYSVNLSNHEITVSNGTRIVCKGLHTQTKREQLKAFAHLNKYSLVIDWREEADQLEKNDFSDIRYALRDCKKKIEINTCNPESLSRYLIRYCNERMIFNEQILKTKYEQISIIKEFNKNKLFHYSSWRMNKMLDDDVKNNLIELESLDPVRARVWSWGLPGQVQGAVFERYLKFTPLTFEPNQLRAGIDFAQADTPNAHKTSASLWMYNNIIQKAHKWRKWTHDNHQQEYLSPTNQCKAIIRFLLEECKKLDLFWDYGLTVNVDYGAGGLAMIDILEQEKHNFKYGDRLTFIKVDKEMWKVVDRVNSFIGAMIGNKMTHDISLEEFNTEYPNIQWKEKPNGGKEEIVDLYDDEFDADYYALSEDIRSIVSSSNNRFVKEYI